MQRVFVTELESAQHFVNLPPHRVIVLEIESGEGADRYPPIFLDLDQFPAFRRPDLAEIFHRQHVGAGQFGLMRQ
jgi:hypothetical protein